MYYVYFLNSKNYLNTTYIGYTKNLITRLKRHNSKLVLSTKPYAPWELIFYEAYISSADAKRREKYFKTTNGRRTLKLMLKNSLSK